MKAFRYCVVCVMAVLIFGTLFAIANAQELARINGIVITEKDFMDRVDSLPEKDRKGLDKEKFMNKLIDEELLIREAQKKNLQDKEEYQRKVETYKKELLVDLYLRQYLNENNTEENQRKYYEENIEKYKSPEMVRISIIMVGKEDEAKDILKKAREGEDFAELAKKYSKDHTAAKGGDYGYRAQKVLRKDFADVAFSMKVGDISEPVKASDGYYIIKLTDHKEEGTAKFEDVKKLISGELSYKLLKNRIDELRKAVNIHIDTAELKNLKTD
jgi:parvulin-like peptidyl-prolyl isomerase